MATAVIVTDLVEITDCDSTTAGGVWSGISESLGSSDPSPLEGSGWIGAIIKQADDSNIITFTPTASIDMTGKHLRVPFLTILKPNLKTKALGGIQIIINGSAIFNVSGGDFYIGGWEMLVCEPNASPDEGSQVTGNVSSIGFNFKLSAAGKNIITTEFDWMSYGTGFRAYGGTSGDEIALAHIDTQDVYYLLAEKQKGVYRLSGKFQLGDDVGTNNCYFKDSGQVIIFEDLDVNSGLYEIKVAGNSTGVTIVDLSGNFITSVADNYKIDFTDDANVDSIILDGTIIQKAGDVFGSSVVEGDGTVFDQCGMLELDDSAFVNFTVKKGTEAAALLFPSTNNMSKAAFVSAGTGHAILVEDTGSITFDNFTFSGYASTNGSTGNECVYNDSGGEVTINVSGGDIPTYRNGIGASTIINAAVNVTIAANVSLAGAEIRIYDLDTTPPEYGTELEGTESHGTATYIYSGTGSNTILIQVMKDGYVEYTQEYTIPTNNSNLDILLQSDQNS